MMWKMPFYQGDALKLFCDLQKKKKRSSETFFQRVIEPNTRAIFICSGVAL